MGELREVQDGAMERLQLKKGDVIVVDNLRAQHGRTPFKGKRCLGLMLSDMVAREAKHQPPSCFEIPKEIPAKRPRRRQTFEDGFVLTLPLNLRTSSRTFLSLVGSDYET